MRISRRAFLGGVAAGAASAASPVLANAPAVSLLPLPRPTGYPARAVRPGADIVAAAELGGKVGYAVCDARTGEMLEVHNPVLSLPPASVTKVITSLYALDTLGEDFRFRTRLLATGPVAEGRIRGDLVLVGGGDPTLDTDALGDMARELAEAGVRGVDGRFLIDATALPQVDSIDPGQPAQAGYNPTISALNLNYNRVYFEWKRQDGGYAVSLDARAQRYRPTVAIARMRVVDRDLPVYTYADGGGADQWTVARPALGNAGGRWLPVRKPARYAGEVFQTLAAAQGIRLRRPELAEAPVRGTALITRESPELRVILRDMLRWSTNLTAEVAGLTATARRGDSFATLAQSAAVMTGWARQNLGLRKAHFVDHSGLGDASQIPASDLVRALAQAGPHGALHRILKSIPMRNDKGEIVKTSPIRIQAKTGTLNFVSALAGYVTAGNGRELCFAILAADMPRRAALGPAERERPTGGRAWTRRARTMQLRLIDRWAAVYGAGEPVIR